MIDVIHAARGLGTPLMLLSLDAEKAFDRVHWGFLRASLHRLGLGEHLMKWIDLIYFHPTARVKVNGLLSDTFKIHNGTSQGCPLSPILFLISIEPFLRRVREDGEIQGVKLPHLAPRKVSAYADYLFFITNPLLTLPSILKEIQLYSNVSNFKLNLTKYEALNIDLEDTVMSSLKKNFRFQWSSSHIRYLGANIPGDLSKICQLNFPTLLTKVKTDLDKWHKGNYTCFGRCTIIKMTLLPRLLYLLQVLPINIPLRILKEFNRTFSRYMGPPPATCII